MNRWCSTRIWPLALVAMAGISSLGWGFRMHRQIAEKAVLGLPNEMLPFFKQHAQEIVKRSVAPDERRNLVKGEAQKHYLDLDLYKPEERNSLPHDWQEAVNKFSWDTLEARGTVPWSVIKTANRLTQAFAQRNRDSIILYAADLTHYIADAHVPFHTTANHDGQLTNQKGIHSFYETQVPEIFADSLSYRFFQPVYLERPSDSIWLAVYEAHALVNFSLEKEREARARVPKDRQSETATGNRGPYQRNSKELIAAYHQALNGTVERQAIKAARLTAHFWYTCWVNAGQPDLNFLECPYQPGSKNTLGNWWRRLRCKLFYKPKSVKS